MLKLKLFRYNSYYNKNLLTNSPQIGKKVGIHFYENILSEIDLPLPRMVFEIFSPLMKTWKVLVHLSLPSSLRHGIDLGKKGLFIQGPLERKDNKVPKGVSFFSIADVKHWVSIWILILKLTIIISIQLKSKKLCNSDFI